MVNKRELARFIGVSGRIIEKAKAVREAVIFFFRHLLTCARESDIMDFAE
ncbi:MAG: hypothetical protein V2A78_03275 [bacterium]